MHVEVRIAWVDPVRCARVPLALANLADGFEQRRCRPEDPGVLHARRQSQIDEIQRSARSPALYKAHASAACVEKFGRNAMSLRAHLTASAGSSRASAQKSAKW